MPLKGLLAAEVLLSTSPERVHPSSTTAHPFSHSLLYSGSSEGWGLITGPGLPKTNSREGAVLLWITSRLRSQFIQHTEGSCPGCLLLPLWV